MALFESSSSSKLNGDLTIPIIKQEQQKETEKEAVKLEASHSIDNMGIASCNRKRWEIEVRKAPESGVASSRESRSSTTLKCNLSGSSRNRKKQKRQQRHRERTV